MVFKYNIQTWYLSIMYILDKLGIHVLNLHGTLCNFAKDKLCDSFMILWNKNKQDILNGNNSKLDIYFSLKNCFDREKYTQINDFKIHQSLCKLIISAHSLRIEKARYDQYRLDRSERLCQYCSLEKIENEQHFLLECPLYNTLRHDFIEKVESHCSNFSSLNNSSKFIWLLTNENLTVLKELGSYINKCLEIRRLSPLLG